MQKRWLSKLKHLYLLLSYGPLILVVHDLYGWEIKKQILPLDAVPCAIMQEPVTPEQQQYDELPPSSPTCTGPQSTGSISQLSLENLVTRRRVKRKKRPHKKNKKRAKRRKYKRKSTNIRQTATKSWTFMIYIAADNDLNFFAWKNIKQMEQIGSNNNVNIVIQLSERGKQKPTQRYVIEKNHLIRSKLVNRKLNSGSPNTLINFCSWAIQTFPAQHYALILWNHGTGANEPSTIKNINPSDLFVFNPVSNLLELDRTISFFDIIDVPEKNSQEYRGICFDETHRSYITNQQLDQALHSICTNHLSDKLSIIGFDACLMSMLEIANIVKKYAHIMVGSQEVELGAGWNYATVLKLFAQNSPTPRALAHHIINSYQQIYGQITNDYTQSAINLDYIEPLEKNVNDVALLLIQCLEQQQANSVKNVLKMCRSRRMCTAFDEPSYIDLHNFYTNVLKNISYFQLSTPTEEPAEQVKKQLEEKLREGIKIIDDMVIANCVGKNLSQARGISICLPEYKLHPTYASIPFASQNKWFNFIQKYISTN